MTYEQLTLDWCYSCGRDEPVPPSGAYIICFECGHVYETGRDLELTYLASWLTRMHDESPPERTADQIVFCPLCLHDF